MGTVVQFEAGDGRKFSGSKDWNEDTWKVGPVPDGTYTMTGRDTDQNELTPQTITTSRDDDTVSVTMVRP